MNLIFWKNLVKVNGVVFFFSFYSVKIGIQQQGEVRKHRQLRIGWFDQHANEVLNGEETPIEYLITKFRVDYQVKF